MLPAAWGAWKAAGLVGKVVSIVAPIAIVLIAFWSGKWLGHSNGYERCQQEHAQQSLEHSSRVVEHTAHQAELPVAVLQELMKDRQEGERIRAELLQKIQRYERERQERRAMPSPEVKHEEPSVCANPDPLDDEFVRHWDDIGRMFLEEDSGGDHAMSTADRDPGGAVEVPTTDIQTATLLRARAAEFDEYKRLRDHYIGAIEFTKGVYIFQKAWREYQQKESMDAIARVTRPND